MDDLNLDSLISDLSNMVRTPSVNPFGGPLGQTEGEEGMATFYAARMQELGMEVQHREVTTGRRNVWGRIRGRGEGPSVMMVGHLDTVGVSDYVDPFEPRVAQDRLYGRGSCDMKAGLAAYLEVARQLIESGDLRGDLIVAGVVDEEHGMSGSIDFGKTGPAVDFAIVGEPTGLEIACAHKGQINSVLRTFGKAVHSSVPELGDNAITRMGRILGYLDEYAAELSTRPKHEICGLPKFNVGVIRGGSNVSSVPDICEVELDRRTVPGENGESFVRELRELLSEAKIGQDATQIEILSPRFEVSPLDLPVDSPLTTAFRTAYENIRGAVPTLSAFPGSTDAPNLQCPAIVCGPGHIAQCHSLDEFVEIAQVSDAVRIYKSAIRNLWSN